MPPPPPSQRCYVCPCKVCKKDPRQKQTVPTINAHRNREQKTQEAAKFRALVPLAITTQCSNNLASTRSNGAVDDTRMTSVESIGRLGGLEVHDEARSGGMSCGSQAPRRTVSVEDGSDDDLDNDEGRRRVTGIQSLWDDERRGDDDEEGDMDTDSFIEYSDEEEAGGNEEAREERRREKKQDAERRKRARRVRPELAGIDAKYGSLS